MPILAAAVLYFEVESITIDGTGACDLVLVTSYGEARIKTERVKLAADLCAPVWRGAPQAISPRWPELRDALYGLLQRAGHIPY